MNEQALTSSWMWTFNGEFRGLYVDIEDGILYWYDNLECQCADEGSFAEQSIQEFQTQGEPGGIGDLPADVSEGIIAILASLQLPGTTIR